MAPVSTPRFNTGLQKPRDYGGDLSDALALSEKDREDLCRTLLAELGATTVREGAKGELITSCVLPFGNHTDQDRNPTASLNYQKLLYNCLGSCQAGGSIIWLIGTARDTSGPEARRWLAKKTRSTGETDGESLSKLLEYFDSVYAPTKRTKDPIPYMDARVLDPWLVPNEYKTAYLVLMRGILEENVERFKLGYGVFKGSRRIVIPHFWRERLVGWQTRRLVDDGTPKYLASPDLPKSQTVFNYNPDVPAVVVEAPLSAVSKDHMAHVEATFGATVTDDQLRLLSMHRKVILFMDNDKAGWKATDRIGEGLSAYSQVLVVENPWNADALDLDDQTFGQLVEDAVPYALWTRPKAKEMMEWDFRSSE